jgi:DinB superfamily
MCYFFTPMKGHIMLDFTPVRDKTLSFTDLCRDLTKTDLYTLTNEMIDTMLAIIATATDEDVVFTPEDPEANDTFGIPEEKDLSWTLGHVIMHVTASAEESAALALTLARGLPVEGRSRYEVPWGTVHSVAQLHHRLEESRRMRHAMLDAWPDEPHLDMTYTPYSRLGPINAVTRFVLGLSHDDAHLEQLRNIMRQAHEKQTTAR